MDRRSFIRAGAAVTAGGLFHPRPGSAQAPADGSSITWVSTTRETPWQTQPIKPMGWQWNTLDAEVLSTRPAQTMQGFGACFNELGWESLQALTAAERETIFRELFAPGVGANFTLCRLPIGANDFAKSWYSYDETPDDFQLKHTGARQSGAAANGHG